MLRSHPMRGSQSPLWASNSQVQGAVIHPRRPLTSCHEGHGGSTYLGFPLNIPNAFTILKFNKEPLSCWVAFVSHQGLHGPCRWGIPNHWLGGAQRQLPRPGPTSQCVLLTPSHPCSGIPNSAIHQVLPTWDAAGRTVGCSPPHLPYGRR